MDELLVSQFFKCRKEVEDAIHFATHCPEELDGALARYHLADL